MSLEHSPANQPARAAYTIPEFCESHRLSRAKLYQLWAAGTGPKFINVGVKRIISVEAAEAWCRQMESAAKDPQAEERTREAAKRAVSFTKRAVAKRAAEQSAGEVT